MDAQVRSFIRDNLPSVWALELLLLLSEEEDRTFDRAALVAALRASDAVIAKSGAALIAAGLVVEDGPDTLRYAPASKDIRNLVGGARALYRSRPDAVRRLIVGRSSGGLDAFADAFRLRKEGE
jgi:hypothetical protein